VDERSREVGLVRKKRKAKYPFAFPGLRADVFFPGSNIPRPIYRDIRLYPKYFGIKKKLPRKLREKRHARV
jgi:hypothetical protein